MTVKLRLTGDSDELARILDAISSVLDVATDGRTYPQRGGFGVRCYAEARLPTATPISTRRDPHDANSTSSDTTDEPMTNRQTK